MKAISYSLIFFFFLCFFPSCQKGSSSLEDETLEKQKAALSAITINEFVGRGSELKNEFGEKEDWLELYNPGEDAVVLEAGRWHLSDNLENLDQFTIGIDIIIPANGFLLIWADGFNLIHNNNVHANFKLNDEGEQLTLSYTNHEDKVQLIDFYNYGPLMEDNLSYGRFPDGSENWITFEEPSPNAANHQ